jgi:type II secretory pathway component PulC
MKSPLWILNSVVAILLLAIVGYMVFSLQNISKTPPIPSIKPIARPEAYQQERPKPRDIKSIYETNDLFGTYKPMPIVEKPTLIIPSPPPPPMPKPVVPQPTPPVQFLEPLPIKISGIVTSSNETKSYVTVINNNTKKSESYKVGDKLFDAYVVRILPKKVILIRSNGQQETLFKSPVDAQAEIKALQDASWSDVVIKQNENRYIVDPVTFVSRINNLAQLIDMVDATTAFKKGVSIGCRIGKMHPKSIGYALGFLPGDIITSINNIEPTTTSNRVTIFNTISQLPLESTITIDIMRHGQKIVHEYVLQTLLTKSAPPQITAVPESQPQPVENKHVPEPSAEPSDDTEAREILEKKQKLNPTLYAVKKQDKQAMRHFGSRGSALVKVK